MRSGGENEVGARRSQSWGWIFARATTDAPGDGGAPHAASADDKKKRPKTGTAAKPKAIRRDDECGANSKSKPSTLAVPSRRLLQFDSLSQECRARTVYRAG